MTIEGYNVGTVAELRKRKATHQTPKPGHCAGFFYACNLVLPVAPRLGAAPGLRMGRPTRSVGERRRFCP